MNMGSKKTTATSTTSTKKPRKSKQATTPESVPTITPTPEPEPIITPEPTVTPEPTTTQEQPQPEPTPEPTITPELTPGLTATTEPTPQPIITPEPTAATNGQVDEQAKQLLANIEAAKNALTVARAAYDAFRKQHKKAAAPKEKKVSAIDAAAQVLAEAGKSMSCQEMIEAAATKGLWESPGGKTPHASLYSAIVREMNVKGTESRFVKDGPGKFARR
jgi:HB1, ASXL, restriction endonuclease HTH domain